MSDTNVENQLRVTNTELNKQIALLEKARKELAVIKKSADAAHEFADSVINTVREPLISLDQDLRVVTVSRSFCEFFQVKPEETVGRLIYDLGNKQWDIPNLRELLETILPEKTTFDDYEVEHDFATIGRRTMLLNARQIEQAWGKERIILLAIEDITERKKIEAGLEKTRKELAVIKKSADEASEFSESIINTIRESLIALDHDLRVVAASRSFYKVFNVKPEETVGRLIYDLGNKQWDIPKLRDLLETILPEKTTFDDYEVEHNFADIGRRIMLLNARQIKRAWGKERIILLAIEDITERRQLETLLEDSEKRYRRLFETANDGILLLEKDEGNIVQANPAIAAMLGYSLDDFIGTDLKDVGFPDDVGTIQEILQTLADDGIFHYKDALLQKKNGKVIDTDIYMVDKTSLIQCNIRDITERKQAEDLLCLSEEKFRKAVLTSPDSIIITRLVDGMFIFANQGCYELSGYTEKEVIGKTSFEIDIWENSEDREKIMEKLSVEGSIKNFESRFRKKNGEVVSGLMSASIIDLNGLPHILTITRDITDRKRAEEDTAKLQAQLQQAQKMEAIGTLAGGIAHDFNNILSAILGYTELAISDSPQGSILLENLEEVFKAGNRAKDLVSQILSFSRQTETQFFQIQIHLIVKEALKLLRASLPATIEINENIRAFGKVLAAPSQVHQILMNLCTNAFHAMAEDGGELSVSLLRVKAPEEPSVPNSLPPAPYLKLTVSDTGCGMTPDILNRIFEPYFTTKGIDKGTGLGLSVVYGIVQSHGGLITVESTPGKGTSFHVYLPEIIDPVKDNETIEKEKVIFTGTERILVVDDEPIILQMLKKTLERLGYEVAGRTSGMDALALFKAKPDQFDLIITDMTMPHMTGYQLSRQLIEIRKDIPIILCTGFHEKISEETNKEIGIREIVMKPILRHVLSQTIRKVLDGEE